MRHSRVASHLGAAALAAVVASCASNAGPWRVEASVSEKVSVLEQRLAADTNDPVAYYNLALSYWSHHRFDQADTLLRKAIVLDPEFALAHLALALVQLPNGSHWRSLKKQGGDSALAREVRAREQQYARAFMIDPFLDVRAVGLFTETYEDEYRDLSVLMNFFLVRRYGGVRDSLPAGLLWPHSIAAARSNHLIDAIKDVQALARASRARDRYDSVSAAPLVTNQYLYMLAALLQRTTYKADAVRIYHEVLANDIGNYEAHVQLARMAEDQKDWGQALAERRAAVNVFPENHRLLMDLGVTQYHAGILPDAETTLQEARSAGPRDPRVVYWLGQVQQSRGERTEARESYEAFLRLAPSRDSTEIATVHERLTALQ